MDRSEVCGSLLPSAVMTDCPRRLMDAPRYQRNHLYGASGRDQDDCHRAQTLPTTSPTPTNASVDIKNPPPRSTAEVQAQALDEHNPHRRPRERPSPFLNGRQQHVHSSDRHGSTKTLQHDKGWTEATATYKGTSIRITRGGENRAAAFHEELSPCRCTDHKTAAELRG